MYLLGKESEEKRRVGILNIIRTTKQLIIIIIIIYNNIYLALFGLTCYLSTPC